MENAKILIDYSKLSGFQLSPNGDKLTIENGTKLPGELKRLLILYKSDILKLLNKKEVKT